MTKYDLDNLYLVPPLVLWAERARNEQVNFIPFSMDGPLRFTQKSIGYSARECSGLGWIQTSTCVFVLASINFGHNKF